MASKSDARAITETLSTTVAEIATLTQLYPGVRITNFDTVNALTYCLPNAAGVTAVPVAGGEGCSVVGPNQAVIAQCSPTSTGQLPIGVVGSGGTYTVEGLVTAIPS